MSINSLKLKFKFRSQRGLLNRSTYENSWFGPLKKKAIETFSSIPTPKQFQFSALAMVIISLYYWKAINKANKVTIFYSRRKADYEQDGSCAHHEHKVMAVIKAVETLIAWYPEAVVEHVIGSRGKGRSYFTFDFGKMNPSLKPSGKFEELVQTNLLNLSELVTDKDDILPEDLKSILIEEVKLRRQKNIIFVDDNGDVRELMCDDRLVVHNSQPTSNAIGMRFYSSYNMADKDMRDNHFVIPNVPNPTDIDIVSCWPTFYLAKYGLDMPVVDYSQNRDFKKLMVNASFNIKSPRALVTLLNAEYPEFGNKYVSKEVKNYVANNKHLKGHLFIGSSFAQEASELETAWQLELSPYLQKYGVEDFQWIHDGIRCDESAAPLVATLAVEAANRLIKRQRIAQAKLDGIKLKDLTFAKADVSIKKAVTRPDAPNRKVLARQKAKVLYFNQPKTDGAKTRLNVINKFYREKLEKQNRQNRNKESLLAKMPMVKQEIAKLRR